MSQGVRAAAIGLLDVVLGEGRALSEPAAARALSGLDDPADRARAQRLALLALRHIGRADRLLRSHLRKRPPLTVLNALRLAVAEILEAGAPAHGVVNEVVAALRTGQRTAACAGLANAVLRKAADEGEAWRRLPPQEMPGWLRGRLSSAYGGKAVAAIERAHARGAALDLTPKDGDAARLAADVGGKVLPTGSVRLDRPVQVTALPGYEAGDWWVQDAAAALPVHVLRPQPGERVADLCAAPGGKTLQVSAAGAEVTAVDLSEERMARVAENLARTGLSARIEVADALEWEPDGSLDAILLDAPCSATGTIRRHPELPFIRQAADLKPLVALQAALIDRAVALLPEGGRLVYCTCSLLPEEGEAQVRAALVRHPGLAVDPSAILVNGVDPGWATPEGGLRLRPDFWADLGGMDGFYIALLRKTGRVAGDNAGGTGL